MSLLMLGKSLIMQCTSKGAWLFVLIVNQIALNKCVKLIAIVLIAIYTKGQRQH